jgi:hypothetical protein
VLGVDGQHLAWMVRDASNGQWTADGLAHSGRLHAAARSAAAQLRRHQPRLRTIDVVVGADLARHWVQTPPASVASLAELQQIAQARRAHLFGNTFGDAAQTWWIAGDWDARRPFVCAAMPAALCADVQAALANAGLTPRWQTLWGLLAQSPPQALPADGWCALRSTSRMLVWHCAGGQVRALLTLPTHLLEDPGEAAARAWQSVVAECTGAALPASGPLHWLDLVAGTATVSHPHVQQVRLSTPQRTGAHGGPTPPHNEAAAALRLHQLLTGDHA